MSWILSSTVCHPRVINPTDPLLWPRPLTIFVLVFSFCCGPHYLFHVAPPSGRSSPSKRNLLLPLTPPFQLLFRRNRRYETSTRRVGRERWRRYPSTVRREWQKIFVIGEKSSLTKVDRLHYLPKIILNLVRHLCLFLFPTGFVVKSVKKEPSFKFLPKLRVFVN